MKNKILTEQETKLKELIILMPLKEFKRVLALKKKKVLSNADLCECGDIIITSLRRYC